MNASGALEADGTRRMAQRRCYHCGHVVYASFCFKLITDTVPDCIEQRAGKSKKSRPKKCADTENSTCVTEQEVRDDVECSFEELAPSIGKERKRR